jgi:hypothetical protein
VLCERGQPSDDGRDRQLDVLEELRGEREAVEPGRPVRDHSHRRSLYGGKDIGMRHIPVVKGDRVEPHACRLRPQLRHGVSLSVYVDM